MPKYSKSHFPFKSELELLQYSKPHLTFESQLELLKKRGLLVTDDRTALEYLRRVGYYRLSGYWYPFRKEAQGREKNSLELREDSFIFGAKFQDVVDLYVFDKKLRLLVLDAIERLEVTLRVDIAYFLGEKDPFAHTKKQLLHPNFTTKLHPKASNTKYEEWLNKYNKL